MEMSNMNKLLNKQLSKGSCDVLSKRVSKVISKQMSK
jgi:hypothetical protein